MADLNITIPPAALEASKKAWYANQHMGTDDRMTAACLAMLKNWPGMRINTAVKDMRQYDTAITLPLTETDDD